MFESPQAAEAAFYNAFEQADIERMMAVWLASDEISCIHPLQRPLLGRNAVRESWEQIFGADPSMRFRINVVQQAQHGSVAVHVVEEHIHMEAERATHAPILATNVYVHTGEGWRMAVHHASPVPDPEPKRQAATVSERLH